MGLLSGIADLFGIGPKSAEDKYRNQQNQLQMEQYGASLLRDAKTARIDANAILGAASAQASATLRVGSLTEELYYKQAAESRRIANLNIGLMKEESAEAVRRMSFTNEQIEDRSRALAGASGVRMEGSTKIYQDSLEGENLKQLNWLQKSWNSRINIAKKEAQSVYSMYMAQGQTAAETALITANSIREAAGFQAGALQAKAKLSMQTWMDYTAPSRGITAPPKQITANPGKTASSGLGSIGNNWASGLKPNTTDYYKSYSAYRDSK